MLTEATTSPQKNMRAELLFSMRGKKRHSAENFQNPENASMRNVAGEIEGAKLAMQFCIDNHIEEIDIYYDYEGVEKWCTGVWKTNKSGTISLQAILWTK